MRIVCRGGAVKRIGIYGHAPGEHGNNVLCAAVSSIAQALHGYLVNTPDALVSARRESGCAEFAFRSSAESDAVFKLCVIGLAQIARENEKISFSCDAFCDSGLYNQK